MGDYLGRTGITTVWTKIKNTFIAKESGKGLSSNDFTNDYKTKLDNAAAHLSDTNNPHKVDKADIGLGNVNNTSDINKPVSTAQQTAINNAISESKSYADTVSDSAASSAVNAHNTNTDAHSDIRSLITGLTTRLNALADSDDTTLDQMSELVAYIKANRSLIESVTTTKVNVSDIVNNLTTNVSNKPLSAAQGVALKALIDALQTAVNNKAESSDLTNHINDKNNPHGVDKSDVGLGNVPNVTTNNQTPTYTIASANSGLKSGETLTVAFGKIAKAVSSLISHLGNTSNPHSVTASQVGLGNVNNTSDANKPVSTAQATAINNAVNEAKNYTDDNVTDIQNTLKNKADKTDIPTKVSELTNDSGYITSYTETDPTVPAWAKASTKPTYTASEVGASPSGHTHDDRYFTETEVTNKLAGKSDTGHTHDDRYYTESEIDTKLSGKSDTNHKHSYNDLSNKPTIPTKTSQLTNDSGFKTTDTNTTYQLTRSGDKIILTGSDGSTTSVADGDTNTTTLYFAVIGENENYRSTATYNDIYNAYIDGCSVICVYDGILMPLVAMASGNFAFAIQLGTEFMVIVVDQDNTIMVEATEITPEFFGAEVAGTAASLVNPVKQSLDSFTRLLSSHTANNDIHFTATERTKLSGIAEGANKYIHPTHTAKSNGFYKVTVDSSGHVSGTTAVSKSDITALGIPAQDTTYGSAGTSLGLVKSGGDVTISNGVITVNDDSHNHTITNVDGLQDALDGKAPASHSHDYLPTTGGTVTGDITFNAKKGFKWTAINSKKPYIGWCTNSSDGTFVIGNIIDTVWNNGLAIGGSSGNLLWKGAKVATVSDIPTKTSQLTNDSGFKTTDTNTTYGLSKNGSTITLTGSDGSTTSVTVAAEGGATYDEATTSASGLMSSSDKTKLNYTNVAYGTCATEAGTAGKVITLNGNTKWVLSAGSIVTVLFSATNTANNPTLNVNSTGAKNVFYGSSQITTSNLGYAGTADRPMTFVYDGTQYRFIGWGYDSNTTYTNVKLGHGYATCSTAEATTAKVGTLSSYTLTTGGIVAVKFTNAVPAGATLNINSKGAKAIYHRGAAIKAGVIKAGDTATFMYSTRYHLLSIDRDDDTISTGSDELSNTTVFNSDGSITVNYTDGTSETTVFNSDGSIVTTHSSGKKTTVTFNSNGSITTTYS